jgi:hypothetical protein
MCLNPMPLRRIGALEVEIQALFSSIKNKLSASHSDCVTRQEKPLTYGIK